MRLLPLAVAVGIALSSAPAFALPSVGVPVDSAASAATAAARPPARRPARPRPDPRLRRPPARRGNPFVAGLAAAGAAGGTALVGGTGTAIAVLALLGAFGAPTLPVMITAGVIAVGLGVGTPFLAGLAAGAALLANDPRTRPTEWSGLAQCATSGCCMGADLIGGTVLGSVCGAAPQLPGSQGPKMPGPNEPAEWTVATAVAGVFGGGVLGALLGWSVAGEGKDPSVPIAIGAVSGAALGGAVLAGAGGGFAEMIRR